MTGDQVAGGQPDGVRLSVLGELRAEVDGRAVDLGGPRQRAVLGPLLLARGAVVPVDQIVEAVWGDRPPQAATASLHSFVSNLRRALRSSSGEPVLVRESVGYALRLPADAVDAWRFEAHVQRGTDQADTSPAEAVAELEAALALWRGTPLLDYRDAPWAEPEVARLTELRAVAREHLLGARLHVQEPALLVPELQLLVDEEPLREERWRLLVLALYRAGRQADALAALRRARQVLSDELGVDPGPALRALEDQVLQQADALAPVARRMAPGPAAPAPPTAAPQAPPPSAASDLVERDRELRALDLVLGRASEGEGTLALVRGPAGIGKTRLMTEVRRRAAARGMRVLRARGSELEQEFGFGAVRQLFEPLLADPADRAQLLSGAAAGAAAVFDVTASGSEEPSFATLHGLYWLTVNAAAAGPLLLSVDDLHWCDAGSLRYLAYVQRRLEGLPLAIVGAARTGERFPTTPLLEELGRDLAGEAVHPGPLSREAVTAVVRSRMGEDADPAFCSACFDSTSGNPLLVRQLLRALEADGIPPDAQHADTARAVGSRAVSSLVLVRLRRLPPSAIAVARALAVLGDGAGLHAVAALAELHDVEVAAATELLAAAEVLRPHAPLGFVHALVRDAVYRDLAAGEQQLLHDRAARLLGGAGAPAEQVAAQLLLAPPRSDPWAVGALRQAAAEAMRRGAPDSARAYLERALAEPAGDLRGQVLFELGLAETSSDGPAALVHLEQAYEELEDGETRGRAAVDLTRTLIFSGTRESAFAFSRRAIDELGDGFEDHRQALVALQRMAGWMRGLPPQDWGYEQEPEVSGSGPGAHMLTAALGWSRFCRNRHVDEVVPLARRAIADGQIYGVDNGLLWATALATLELCDVDVMGEWASVMAAGRSAGRCSWC
jgi:DNA-binding SARP family transcriptional activator